MTLEQAAGKLYKTKSALQRIESAETKADVHLVRSMMDLYDEYDPSLEHLAVQAAERGWWRQYGLADNGFVDLETEASQLREFGGFNIPGLLQVPEFIDALLRRGPTNSEQERRNGVQVRLARQKRLTDEDHPIAINAIIDESALHRVIGGPAVMRDQLRHLVKVATLSNVTMRVLPFAAGAHAAMNGSFLVLEFPEITDPDVLFIECLPSSYQIEDAKEIRKMNRVFDQMIEQSLSPDETVVRIERIAEERYSEQG